MEQTRIDLDPLGRLPTASSLAWTSGGPRPPFGDPTLVRALLRLDPILYLRSYRIWASRLPPGEAPAVPLPDQLCDELGSSAIARLLAAPASPVRRPGRLLGLWWHSVAAASAAASLAECSGGTGDLAPDRVFLHGLLHELGTWSQVACHVGLGAHPWIGPLSWTEDWRLPESVRTCWLASEAGSAETTEHEELVRHVLAGEAMAELAIAPHHGRPRERDERLLRELVGDEGRALLHELESRISRILAPARLSRQKLETDPAPQDFVRFQAGELRPPPIERAIVELLELGDCDSQRRLLDVLVTGGARYLGFDRAFFFQWVGNSREGMFRAVHDLAVPRLLRRVVRPNPSETMQLGRAAGSGTPVLLHRREGQREGLLADLGIDEAFVVPVSGGGHMHGFLLLDHAYSPHRRVSGELATRALAFAGVCGLNLGALVLRRRQERTLREAQTDHLTGLCNRRAAMQRIHEEIQRVRQEGRELALLMLDLDHFKQINDVHGHLTGDRVLAAVGEILREHVRETDLAARVGGEEFLVIEPDTGLEDAAVVAARISSAVEERGAELGVALTISVGLTELRSSDSVDSVLARADRALYASKSLGRNRFSVDSE